MIEERYEIIKLLGKGRTGGVYEAEDTNLGRKVALRRFFAQSKQTDLEEYKTDFENVTHALSALQHPNLLRVYDAGVDQDGAFIISQLLKGDTLHDKIKDGPIPIWEVYDLAQQMLDALSTAHSEGFVHGAITPGSILMSPRARGGFLYVILDMGLSRLAPLIQGKDSILSIMADPAILAPELFAGGIANERADLYMFGHILYMSIAGGHPFGGVPALEAEKMHQAGLPPLQQYNVNVPEDFRLWIEKLIQLNPDDRPASAVEALNSLPKVQRPSNARSTQIHTAAASLNPGSTQQQQSPVGDITGPLTGVAPVTPNPAAAEAGLLVATPKTSKKGLFIGLGAVAAVIIIIVMLSGGNEGEKSTAEIAKPVEVASTPRASSRSASSGGTGKSYAERNAIAAEKIIIAHFDGTKPAANNRSWLYLHKAKQKAATDGWSITNDEGSKIYPGIRFPLKSNENDMFDFGWKLTYIVRPVKGQHRFGFQIDKKLNPGWTGDDVSLLLVVEHTAEGEVTLSARDSEGKINSAKSITTPYKGEEGWHTILVEQKPEDESGTYTVSIDGTAAFSSEFTKGIDYGSWSNQLFSFGSDIGSLESQWVVKELKLETP
ncbi:MAG: serine/threonine protein kinase [Cryomorphaceae bacterium]|jgi:serine/threonine protein kinase